MTTAPDMAWITPAHDGRPASINILYDGKMVRHEMALHTMTKLAVQLATEIKNATETKVDQGQGG